MVRKKSRAALEEELSRLQEQAAARRSAPRPAPRQPHTSPPDEKTIEQTIAESNEEMFKKLRAHARLPHGTGATLAVLRDHGVNVWIESPLPVQGTRQTHAVGVSFSPHFDWIEEYADAPLRALGLAPNPFGLWVGSIGDDAVRDAGPDVSRRFARV